jgi:hypothetical protein
METGGGDVTGRRQGKMRVTVVARGSRVNTTDTKSRVEKKVMRT